MAEEPLTNEAVLARHVPWESYKTSGQLSDKDYALIKRLDKSNEGARAAVLEESTPAAFEALFNVLRTITNQEIVQYALALLDDITTTDPAIIPAMHKPSPEHKSASPPNAPLVLSRLLTRSDWFTQARAAKLLAAALRTAPQMDDAIVGAFLEWLTGQLRQPSCGDASVEVATGALGGLLRSRSVRSQYALNVPLLESALKAGVRSSGACRSQTLYNLGLCLWQLTYDDAGLAQLQKADCVPPLVDLLKQGNKEKVMRVALLTLARLLEEGGPALEAQLVESGLPRIIRIRSAQSFADEDIPELLETLDERLREQVVAMSSLEKYRKEVLSGQLDWGPMHTSTQFWQENAEAMEDKDCQLVRQLIKLAGDGSTMSAKALAVAASDLGMFCTAHANGRFIVNDLGGKSPMMRLMQHPDAEVQKHALLTVQKLMLGRDKLDFLKRPARADASTSEA